MEIYSANNKGKSAVTENVQLSDSSGFGKNVILFCVNMSSSGHDDNRKKDTVDSVYLELARDQQICSR